MAKLIKFVVILALLGGGIALAVHFASSSNSKKKPGVNVPAATEPKKEADGAKKKDGMEPQEKYGFAPSDAANP